MTDAQIRVRLQPRASRHELLDVRGERSREKLVQVRGVRQAALEAALEVG